MKSNDDDKKTKIEEKKAEEKKVEEKKKSEPVVIMLPTSKAKASGGQRVKYALCPTPKKQA